MPPGTRRALRTGQLQQSQGAYAGLTTNPDKQQALKKAFCDRAFLFTDCTSNGVVINDSAAAFNTGSASSVVLVTVCYPWDFGGKLPMLKIGNLANGALLMQASAAFRTKPYN